MPLRNFSIWRGRLPHWRADDVRYYVTFRHRRALDGRERDVLFNALMRASGARWELLALCVLPDTTELLAAVGKGRDGRAVELGDIVEPAKRRAAKTIVRATGERFGPFYAESYDRIVRDEVEFRERWEAIVGSPAAVGLDVSPTAYPTLWIA